MRGAKHKQDRGAANADVACTGQRSSGGRTFPSPRRHEGAMPGTAGEEVPIVCSEADAGLQEQHRAGANAASGSLLLIFSSLLVLYSADLFVSVLPC